MDNASLDLPTTGVGSLPHSCIDSALQFSFRHSIPYLPQIPIRNPKEFMMGQSLSRLPGLSLDEHGIPTLDKTQWAAGSENLKQETETAFKNSSEDPSAFENFEPSPEYWSCWKPFLFELEEKKSTLAKIQIAGPLTCQWALKFSDKSKWNSSPEVGIQIFRLILAKSVAMIRKLKSLDVHPILIIDEPGFYTFNPENVHHTLALNELRLFIQSLKKEQASIGIHCCSNTHWDSVLSLPLDFLSFDTELSLNSLLSESKKFPKFIKSGGRFILGIVPTNIHQSRLHSLDSDQIVQHFHQMLPKHLDAEITKILTKQSILSPACGLALHTVGDSEAIASLVFDIAKKLPESSPEQTVS